MERYNIFLQVEREGDPHPVTVFILDGGGFDTKEEADARAELATNILGDTNEFRNCIDQLDA